MIIVRTSTNLHNEGQIKFLPMGFLVVRYQFAICNKEKNGDNFKVVGQICIEIS